MTADRLQESASGDSQDRPVRFVSGPCAICCGTARYSDGRWCESCGKTGTVHMVVEAEEAPSSAYNTGFENGQSDVLADVDTLCDQLDIEVEEKGAFEAIRDEITRLRLEVEVAEIRRDMGL